MSRKKQLESILLQRCRRMQQQKIGIDVSGHGLRCLFVMTLVNDPSVSIEKALHASRHLSVAAQRPNMTLDRISEASRFKALGMKTKKGDGQAKL